MRRIGAGFEKMQENVIDEMYEGRLINKTQELRCRTKRVKATRECSEREKIEQTNRGHRTTTM